MKSAAIPPSLLAAAGGGTRPGDRRFRTAADGDRFSYRVYGKGIQSRPRVPH
jgi:hypothetical protein